MVELLHFLQLLPHRAILSKVLMRAQSFCFLLHRCPKGIPTLPPECGFFNVVRTSNKNILQRFALMTDCSWVDTGLIGSHASLVQRFFFHKEKRPSKVTFGATVSVRLFGLTPA